MSQMTDEEAGVFLPSRKVLRRYDVSDMTIHRWLNNPEMNFPRPVYFGRNRFWRLTELQSWERARALMNGRAG